MSERDLMERAGYLVNQVTRALDMVPRNHSAATKANYEAADRIALQHFKELLRQPAVPVQVSEAMVSAAEFAYADFDDGEGPGVAMRRALEAALQAGVPEDEADIAERLVAALGGKTAIIFTDGNEWCVRVDRTEIAAAPTAAQE